MDDLRVVVGIVVVLALGLPGNAKEGARGDQ
jgi:hypothetical protein